MPPLQLLSGRGGVLDLEECLGPLRLAAAILETSTTELNENPVLEGVLSIMTDLYSLPAFQDESILIFCICRLLLISNRDYQRSSSLSNARRYERSLLKHAVKVWSLHAAVGGPTQDVMSLISCLVHRCPRMQTAAVNAGVPKLICEAADSAATRKDLIVPLLHLACNLCANNDEVKVNLLRNRGHMPSEILALAISACVGGLDRVDEETEEASFSLLQNAASSSRTITLLTHQSAGLETCLRQVSIGSIK